MNEFIHGFQFQVKGAELIGMCNEQLLKCAERKEKLVKAAARVGEMSEEDRQIAGLKVRGGDMADEVANNIKRVQQEQAFFEFAVKHIDPSRVYLLAASDLKKFGIEHPDRY